MNAALLPHFPSHVYGVDFSGSKKAGTKIWIASATIIRGALKIEECYPVKDLPSSTVYLDQCLGALRDFISAQKMCAFGLDFPFGLPKKVIKASNWEEFVLSFANTYANPQQFRETCWVAAGNREERRDTDRISKTPFSPYNRRLYRQTYYGIRDLLGPLVRHQFVYVLPMQRPSSGRPWLFEVCPASTLRSINLYLIPYKGTDKERRLNRTRIIEGVMETGVALIDSSELFSTIIDDRNGDALDSVIAAFATFRALCNMASPSVLMSDSYALEGYVYV